MARTFAARRWRGLVAVAPIGALLAHVTQAGVRAGFGADLNQWDGPAIELAVAETRAFKSNLASTPETKTAA